ncbi:INO80 complex subunit E-like [Dermochelys coriacea]|uniref:INO80 complex subunit E-like n=1 Tax=Dermochelys coriacea TaxID=27794 RepID=UPI0018E7BB43|nr:INO80 complex subunit E-like [Dermochelys coriacea]
MNGAEADSGSYKQRYLALKRCLRLLIYEQECFQEELRKGQRKLLKVSRDKSFLLDRLLQHEHMDKESSDSEATVSSENSDGEGPQPLKRKRSPQLGEASSPSSSGLSLRANSGFPLQGLGAPSPYLSLLASPCSSPFPSEYLVPEPFAPRPERARPKRWATRKLKMSLTPATHPDCSVVGGFPFSLPQGGPLTPLSSKLPQPTILSTVPQQEAPPV